MMTSVVICTYNRAASLRLTLDTLARAETRGLEWELVLVDNNSNDGTAEVGGEFAKKLPLRCIFEPQPGKSHALNRAIAEAKGDLLLFTDDDVDIEAGWLRAMAEAAKRHPERAFFGGKIIPRWEGAPPKWMEENYKGLLCNLAVSYDIGEGEKILNDRASRPFPGANLAIRAEVLVKSEERFPTHLGPRGHEPVRGEEGALQVALLEKGFTGLYVPAAVIHHRNSARRMTERYVREWFKGDGMGIVRRGEIEPGEVWMLDAPRYLWRRYLESVAAFLWARATKPSSVWLEKEIKMATNWGIIVEFRNQRKAGRP